MLYTWFCWDIVYILSSTVIRIYGLPLACQAFSSLLNRTGDVVHGGRLLQTACQIHHGHIRGGHSEGHPRQLAVHRWDHLANSLGSSGGRWDDVLRCATSTAPILAAVAVASSALLILQTSPRRKGQLYWFKHFAQDEKLYYLHPQLISRGQQQLFGHKNGVPFSINIPFTVHFHDS